MKIPYLQPIFNTNKDKQLFADAILWSTADPQNNDIDLLNLRKILHSAHTID